MSNDCPDTNSLASEIIGKEWAYIDNFSSNTNGVGLGSGQNAGGSKQLVDKVEPAVFPVLANGGPLNDWLCEAIVYRGGDIFNTTGDTWLRTAFLQEF